MSEKENFQLKLWFNPALVQAFVNQVSAHYPAFDGDAFSQDILSELDTLEFKQRIALIAQALHTHLPQDYPTAISILLKLLDVRDGDFKQGGHLWVIDNFVELYGIAHYDQSIQAMYQITQRHSSEFSIRPFLMRYQARTLAILHEWKHDESEHVRRLVSEGTRPRLPWGGQLKAFITDPTPTLALLEALQDDPSEYVRRSVANHLNDISKDHPDKVLDTLERWSQNASAGTQWLIKHALRTQLKAGSPRALALLGYGTPDVTLDDFVLSTNVVNMGDSFTLSFRLRNDTDHAQNLMVDYIMHFMKANGSTSPKVFKLKVCELPAHDSLTITKSHTIRPISTRKYYAGTHRVEIQVNGQVLGGAGFALVL